MTKVIMHGCTGRMGHVIVDLAKSDDNIEIVAGVDAHGENTYSFPVFDSVEKCDVEADVLIDFSTAAAVDNLLKVCTDKKLPVVLCTTGLSDEQLANVEAT